MTEPHEFSGSLIVCLKCYLPKQAAIHISLTPHVVRSANAEEPDIKTSNIVPDLALYNASVEVDTDEFDVFKLPSAEADPGEVPEECSLSEQAVTVRDVIDSLRPVTHDEDAIISDAVASEECSVDHECPECKDIWHHDYQCDPNKSKKVGLCHACASQAAVEISRPTTIEQIAQTSSQNLGGREVTEIMIEHESFVLLNLIYEVKLVDGLPTQVERENWQELINEHRRNLKRDIEKLRVKELAVSRVVLKKQSEDMQKLSPEEVAQYKRDAGKKAAGKVAGKKASTSDKKDEKQTADDAYKKMLKSLCADIRKKKPGLTDDEIVKRAERQAAILQAEDEA